MPIDAILPAVRGSLSRHASLVIEAAPGAGKTTRVPPALLEEVRGEVVVLEPRRIAARLAARRISEEMGERVGGLVGYQVRFDEAVGQRTRLRFVTEGVFTRRLLSDPLLKGVDAVVLDEFHERHLESDLALALLKRLNLHRPELRTVVMSATLDAAPIARFLGDCPVLRSEGRMFEVTIEHLPYSPKPLEQQVSSAVESLLRRGHQGDTLVFLPGLAEIRRALRACEAIAHSANLLLLPLHGDLTPAEQDRAISPAPQRKIILATNVAESSVTVEGVTAIVDSGLARVATFSPWTGLPTLQVARISKASAKQRAGRAGRTAPGRVLRLYSAEDYAARPEFDPPEIARSDLSQLCLSLRVMGLKSAAELEWLDPPPPAALESAEKLLDRIGAVGERARELSRYPLPPRLARVVVAAIEQGVGEQGIAAAALLGSGQRCERNDLLAALDAPVDPMVRQQMDQLHRIARLGIPKGATVPRISKDDDALLKAVLAGFPDRVGRRRAGNEVSLCTGIPAELSGEPVGYEFVVAVDVEDRKDKPLPLIRMTSRIEPEWLIDVLPENVQERSAVEWNRAGERVEAVSAIYYDALVIQESRGAMPDPMEAADLLAMKAMEAGLDRFIDREALDNLAARVDFAGLAMPDLPEEMRELCRGLRSFAELEKSAADFVSRVERKIGQQQLQIDAPVRLRLQGGRETKVHYEVGKPPWIASRLQDFFGMRETPRIGPRQTPVVVHLLAPNQRAVQTTADLAGFWQRLYPEVRRELMRRYPRHSWPEKPC